MTWETLHTNIREALEQTAESDANVLANARRARARLRRSQRERSSLGRLLLTAAGVLLVSVPWLTVRFWPVGPAARIAKETPSFRVQRLAPAQEDPPLAAPPTPATPIPERAALAPTPDLPQGPAAPPPGTAPPSWEAVAKAMREGDDARARSMIQRLEASPDAETREHARLTALQLSASSTRAAGGQTKLSPAELQELRELAVRGTTSSVRLAARQLLEPTTAEPTTAEPTTAEPQKNQKSE